MDSKPLVMATYQHMTPYGIRNSETKVEGQVWELKFSNLPCTVYRWLYPALDVPITTSKEEKK